MAKNADNTKLTDKQKRFCDEYFLSLNATQAAIFAGYSAKTAFVIANETLRKPYIQDYLASKKKKVADKYEITQDKVLKEYSRIAFTDMRSFYETDGTLKPIHELDDDAAAAMAGLDIEEVKYAGLDGKEIIKIQVKKIKRWDKVKALDSICKVLGFQAPTKIEANITGNVNLIFQAADKCEPLTNG